MQKIQKQTKRWKLLKWFDGGHKIFECLTGAFEGAFAIADDSGKYPHLTEDGTLLIDESRQIRQDAEGRTFSIPVCNPEGKMSTTVAWFPEASWIAAKLKIELVDKEGNAYVLRLVK